MCQLNKRLEKETHRPTVRFASFMGARHLQGSILFMKMQGSAKLSNSLARDGESTSWKIAAFKTTRAIQKQNKVASASTPVSGSVDARQLSKVAVPVHSPVLQERRQNPTSGNATARLLGLAIRRKSNKKSTYSANVFTGKKVRVVSGLQRRTLGHSTNAPIFLCNAEGCHEIPIYGWPGTHSTQIIQYVVLLTNSLE